MFVRSVAGGGQQKRRSRVSVDQSAIRKTEEDKVRRLKHSENHKYAHAHISKLREDLLENTILEVPHYNVTEQIKQNISRFDNILYHDLNFEKQLISPVILEPPRKRKISKRISIRVQGHLYETQETTLKAFPTTLLGQASEREKYYDKDKNEYIFLNRCAISFDAILFYYQSKGILSKPGNIKRDKFIEELKFFSITHPFDMRHRTELAFAAKVKRAKVPPPSKYKKYIWHNLCFRNDPNTRNYSYVFYIFGNIILSSLGICLEPSIPSKQTWMAVESFLCVFFTLEYIIQIYISKDRKEYMCSPFGVMDLFTMISSQFTLLNYLLNPGSAFEFFTKHLRLVRLFKCTKVSHGMQQFIHVFYECREFLLSFILTVIVSCLICSSLVQLCEESFSTNYKNEELMNWFWYSFITASGVGYGDIYPSTIAGKFCGASMSIVGVLLFCLPASHIICKFVEYYYLPDIVGEGMDARKKRLIAYTRSTFLGDIHQSFKT